MKPDQITHAARVGNLAEGGEAEELGEKVLADAVVAQPPLILHRRVAEPVQHGLTEHSGPLAGG